MKECVARFNIQDHIVYNTKIVECVFDEEQGAWLLTSKDGRRWLCTAIVLATGGAVDSSSSSSSGSHCSSSSTEPAHPV
jgi:cation diffusion facilitator CzcD-associated flavoprotein CzcO